MTPQPPQDKAEAAPAQRSLTKPGAAAGTQPKHSPAPSLISALTNLKGTKSATYLGCWDTTIPAGRRKKPLRGAQETAEKKSRAVPILLVWASSSSCGCCTAESPQLIHQTQPLQTWQGILSCPHGGALHPQPAPGQFPAPVQGMLREGSS